MFGTMDFGHSDIWHFNFPLKFFLAETLKSGFLPLWSKNLGTGFPLLAEGQIGLFNPFNFFLFKFFDPVTAFNLSFLIIFLTTASGTYLFARSLKLKYLSALFAALIFALSGPFFAHAVHFNLIQALSFLPWLFYLAQTKRRWLFSLVLALQIYSGFQQVVLITLIGLLLYRRLPIFAVIFGFLLAFPQILLSAQFTQNSFRDVGVHLKEMVKYPFPPIHLLTFLNPYFLGDPRIGTYPTFGTNWGIFWESTGYIGILPLFLILKDLKKIKKNLIFWIILGVSLILLLGKYTPFFFLYQLPPLNMFRVPARFLFLFVWILVILAAFSFDRIKNQTAKLIIFVVAIIDISYFSVTYNATINPGRWLTKPESVKFLETDPGWFRITSVYPYVRWNHVFLKKGWSSMEEAFALRNNLDPNQNLFWQISSADVYAGILPKRYELWKGTVNNGITIDNAQEKIFISSASAKLYSQAGVKYLLTPYPLDQFDFVATISANPQVLIYKNKNAYPHAYLAKNFEVISNMTQLDAKLKDPANEAVILEKPINLTSGVSEGKARVIKNENMEIEIETESSQSALLVLSDSFYPGWKAFLDDRPVEILPVNLNQRAVIVGSGRHQVRFVFQPFSPDNILSLFRLENKF